MSPTGEQAASPAASPAASMTAAPSMLARAEEIQRQIQEISGRDWQLWSIGLLMIVVLATGLLSLILPNVVWAQHVIHIEQAYLPQLFFGLISLILLFNLYLLSQKLTLNATRRALINELVLNERLENLSLIDPLSQLMNRRALNEVLPREVARANRIGSALTLMAIDIENFKSINELYGAMEGNLVLVEFSRLLKTVFRGADVAFRQGGDEFLVAMPDTSEAEADFPLQRLQRMVEEWNANNGKEYKMSFNYGIASYATGSDVADTLRAVDRKLYQKKHHLVPVF